MFHHDAFIGASFVFILNFYLSQASSGMGRVHQGQVSRFCRAPEKEKHLFALVLTHTMESQEWHN